MKRWRSSAWAWLSLLALGPACKIGRNIVSEVSDPAPAPLSPDCLTSPPCEPLELDLRLELPTPDPCSAGACSTMALDDLQETGVVVTNARLQLASMTPIQLSFRGATLMNVRIELTGPVTVRFADDSYLDGVQLWLSGLGGEPRVAVVDSRMSRVGMQTPSLDADQDRIGWLQLERTEIASSSLRARTLESVSSAISRSRLVSESMTLADVLISECELGFHRGIVAGADFESVRTLACDELLFSHGAMSRSHITCDELLRVYAANVVHGALDGNVQADTAYVQNTTLGLDGPTSIDVWESTIERVSFCEQSEALQLGGGAVAVCVDCADAPDLQACRIDVERARSIDSSCPLLHGSVPACEMPWPVRERPR